jgi:hypothetical protein
MPPMWAGTAVAKGVVLGVAVTAVVVGRPGTAQAERDYFAEQDRPLTYRADGQRSARSKIALASLAAAAAAAAGTGVGFHRAANRAAEDVRALRYRHTRLIYAAPLEERRQDAVQYQRAAALSYAAAASLTIAAVVTYALTIPPDEIHEYGRSGGRQRGRPYAALVAGGAVVGASWRY